MADAPRPEQMLKRVANRMALARFGKRFYVAFLAVAGVYAALLLVSRLSGLIPDWFDLRSLAVIPAAALVIALVFVRKVAPSAAARRVDTVYGTKNLFLTYAMLAESPGEYAPLVARDAENKAGSIKPAAIVPFRWEKRLMKAATSVAVLLVAVLYLNQWDPFGRVEASDQIVERKKELDDTKKATELRARELEAKRSGEETEQSKQVAAALEELKQGLRQMKRTQPESNSEKLGDFTKKIGGMWRKLNAEGLKDMKNSMMTGQDFGGASGEKMKQWSKELQEGSTASLDKELQELKKELEDLAGETDPQKRAEKAQKIKEKLRDMEEFASEKAGAKNLAAALKRAMKQLEMSKLSEMSEEAREALEESLDLADMELEEMKQSAEDLKKLEEALETMQMAKQLNQEEMLDGEACSQCEAMAEYAEMYAELMAEMGQGGDGGELGGEGIGEGGEAPEDDSVATDFKREQSKSEVTAGKVLLSLSTKGLSDSGEARMEYVQALEDLEQGASEAISQEQIPPGYHEGIKKYFGALKGSAGGETPSETPAAE